MTMIGMMPREMRIEMVNQLTPRLDRNPHSPASGLTAALDELFDELRR